MKKEKGNMEKCQGTLKKEEKGVPRSVFKRLITLRKRLPKLKIKTLRDIRRLTIKSQFFT